MIVPCLTLIAFSILNCRIVVGIRLIYYTRNPVKRAVSAFLSSSLSSNRTSLLPCPAVVEFLLSLLPRSTPWERPGFTATKSNGLLSRNDSNRSLTRTARPPVPSIRILNNSINGHSPYRNPYSLNSATIAIRIWFGTPCSMNIEPGKLIASRPIYF